MKGHQLGLGQRQADPLTLVELAGQPTGVHFLPAVRHFSLGIRFGLDLEHILLGAWPGRPAAFPEYRTHPQLKAQPLAGVPFQRHRLAVDAGRGQRPQLLRVGEGVGRVLQISGGCPAVAVQAPTAAARGDNQAKELRGQFAKDLPEQAVHRVVGILQTSHTRPSLELPHVDLGAQHLQRRRRGRVRRS